MDTQSLETPAQGTHHSLVGFPFARGRSFDRAALLVGADWPADAAYLIRRGLVRCFLLDDEGRETTTAILGRGELVGFSSMFGDTVHHTFAEAMTKVETWLMPADQIRQAQSSRAAEQLRGLLLGCLARRLELAIALQRAVSLLCVSERVRDIQLRLSASLGMDYRAVKRTALAGLLQIRPETLARAEGSNEPLEAALAQHRRAIARGTREFHAHQVVLDGEPPCDCVGLVVSGRVQLHVTGPAGREITVEILEDGDLFGTAALIGLPATRVRLVALTNGSVEVAPAVELLNRLHADPELCTAAIARFAHRLEHVERGLATAALPNVRERLVQVLRDASSPQVLETSGVGSLTRTTWSHVALARHLGVCRETITRSLASLTEAGVIRRDGRRIVLVGHGRPASGSVQTGSASPQLSIQHAGPASDYSGTACGSDLKSRGYSATRTKCRLCGLRGSREVCEGCADRLERDLERHYQNACPDCGRHRELCELKPCHGPDVPASRTSERPAMVWLRTDSIDEPTPARNSRRAYQDESIRELAASLRTQGLLQPVCVRPNGQRYEVVFGVRRLRAARQAGLEEVPCTVQIADDDRAFLLNAMENLHREQLTNTERIRTIERLASTGLGVREISRRTGFNASTISRWLRINGRVELKRALEEDRIDIARAAILVEAPPSGLDRLLEQAMQMPTAELRRQVASLRREQHRDRSRSDQRRHMMQALLSLRAVVATDDQDLLWSIQQEIDRLFGEARFASLSPTGERTPAGWRGSLRTTPLPTQRDLEYVGYHDGTG